MARNGTNGHKVVAPASLLDAEGFYCIKGELLWKYRAMEAEHQAAQAKLSQISAAVHFEIEKNPQLKMLLSEKTEAAKNASLAIKEVAAVSAEIEAVLGVQLKDCGIDDKTGRVMVFAADGSESPLAPVGQNKKAKKRATTQKEA